MRLEEIAPSRDRDDRAADTTGTDDEDPHRSLSSLAVGVRAPAISARSFQSMVPVKQWSSLAQAPWLRSQFRPLTYGPRSMTGTVSVTPL